MKKIKNVLLNITNIISVIFIVIAVIVLITVLMTKSGDAPNIMGYSMLRVVTGSMNPTIPEDSMIFIKRVDPSEIKENDVISFYSEDPTLNGMINTHRVIEIDHENDMILYKTKGDANSAPDMYGVHEANLIGKVIYTSKAFGTLLKLVANPLVFIPIIILPLIIILLTQIVSAVRTAKKIAKEEEEKAIKELAEKLKKDYENNQSSDKATTETKDE